MNGDAASIIQHIDTLFGPMDRKIDQLGQQLSTSQIELGKVATNVKNQGREIGEIKQELKDQKKVTADFPKLVTDLIDKHESGCHARTEDKADRTGAAVVAAAAVVPAAKAEEVLPRFSTLKWAIIIGVLVGASIAGFAAGTQITIQDAPTELNSARQ